MAISPYNPNAIPNRGLAGPTPPLPDTVPPPRVERFMGNAQQVFPEPAVTPQGPTQPRGVPGMPPQQPAAGLRGGMNGTASSLAGDGVTAAERLGQAAPQAPGALSRGLGAVRGVLNNGMGKLSGGLVAAASIYDSSKDDSTATYAKRFGVSEPTGDGSVGDIAKFVGLRAGGFASDLGNNLLMGAPKKFLFRDGQPDVPGAAAAPAPIPGAAAAPVAPAGPADAFPDHTEVTAAENNNAERFGVPVYAQRNAQAISPVGLRGGFANENLTTDPEQANRNLRASVAGIPQGEQVLVHGLDGGSKIYASRDAKGQLNLTGTGDGSADAAYRNSDQYKDGMARAAGDKAQLAQIEADKGDQTLQGLQNAYRTAAPGQGKRARVALEQYIEQKKTGDTLASQQMIAKATNRMEAMKMMQTQANSDREYQRGLASDKRAETTQAQAIDQQNFAQKEAATKAVQSRLEAMHTTTDEKGNQVVDKAGVARATEGIQAFLGNRAAALQAQVQRGGPNAAAAAAELKVIQEKGAAGLDDKHLNDIVSQTKLAERIKATHSVLNPFGSTYVESSNPDGYKVVGRKDNTFGSDDLITANGSRIREKNTLYDEPANIFTTNRFKNRTTDFNPAKGLKQ